MSSNYEIITAIIREMNYGSILKHKLDIQKKTKKKRREAMNGKSNMGSDFMAKWRSKYHCDKRSCCIENMRQIDRLKAGFQNCPDFVRANGYEKETTNG